MYTLIHRVTPSLRAPNFTTPGARGQSKPHWHSLPLRANSGRPSLYDAIGSYPISGPLCLVAQSMALKIARSSKLITGAIYGRLAYLGAVFVAATCFLDRLLASYPRAARSRPRLPVDVYKTCPNDWAGSVRERTCALADVAG